MFTVKEKIMIQLQKKPWSNINELAEVLEKDRVKIIEKLTTAKRQGFVVDRFVKRTMPWGGPVLMHVWNLTKSGEKWVGDQKT